MLTIVFVSYRSSSKDHDAHSTLMIHACSKHPGNFLVRKNFQYINVSTKKKYEEFWPRDLGKNTNKIKTLLLFHVQEIGKVINLLKPLFMNGFPQEIIRCFFKKTFVSDYKSNNIYFSHVNKKLKYRMKLPKNILALCYLNFFLTVSRY